MTTESTVANHETRITVIEKEIQNLTPRLEMVEEVQPLRNQIDRLERTVEELTKTVSQLSKAISEGMGRITDLNEENMRRTAQQAEEKHQAELQIAKSAAESAKAETLKKEAEIEKLRIEKEERVWHKQMKSVAGWIAVISGGVAATAALIEYLRALFG